MIMRKTALHIALILVLICIAQLAWGQNEFSYPIDTINGKAYYRYNVERSIGLYRISVKFGVKQEEILQANPTLQQRGLRYGEEILVPVKATVQLPKNAEPTAHEIEPEVQTPEQKIETQPEKQIEEETTRKPIWQRAQVEWEELKAVADTMLQQDTIVNDSIMADSLVLDSTTIRLAMLLPLQADVIKRDKNIDRFYDFYAGALIAIYQAQAKGQKLEVFTYDTGRTTNELKKICQQPDIHQVDAIIGPAFSQQVAMVIDSTAKDSIWTLVPFLSKVNGIEQHPYLMQFNPSDQVVADTLAKYLAQRKDSINCVLVEAKENDVIPSSIAALHKALKQQQIPQTSVSVHSILVDSMAEAFVPGVENIIIFNTEKYTNMLSVMPHLMKIYGQFRITLFSQYSWQKEKIPLPQLYTSVFASEPVVSEEYETLYRQYFNHQLASTRPRYDLLGYDLTSQLIQMLVERKTTDIRDWMNTHIWEGAQANIHYQSVGENGGWENQIIQIIHQ
jgi:hypothetical protein